MKNKKAALILMTVLAFFAFAQSLVFAEAKINKVTQICSPTKGTAGDITLTYADKLPVGNGLCFEIAGLGDNYYYTYSANGEDESNGWFDQTDGDKAVGCIWTEDYECGSYTYNISVKDWDENVVYGGISMTFEVSDDIGAPENTLSYKPVYAGVGAESKWFGFESINSYNNLTAKLLGKDKTVYAVGEEIYSYEIRVKDERYASIYDYSTIYTTGHSSGVTLKNARYLTAGKYDLAVYDGNTQVALLENAVEITATPLIKVTGGDDVFPSAHDGDTEFYVGAELTGGDAKDFSIELYDDGGKTVAKSAGWVCTRTSADGDSYAVKMKTVSGVVMDENTAYKFGVKSDKTFINLTSGDMYTSDGGFYSVDVPNSMYANFVLKTGFSSDERYKIELEYEDDVLGTVYQFPNEDGIFDVEFTDENGDVIMLENDGDYDIYIYTFNEYSGEWNSWGSHKNCWIEYDDIDEAALTAGGIYHRIHVFSRRRDCCLCVYSESRQR